MQVTYDKNGKELGGEQTQLQVYDNIIIYWQKNDDVCDKALTILVKLTNAVSALCYIF